jgi:hypothetical protein
MDVVHTSIPAAIHDGAGGCLEIARTAVHPQKNMLWMK